MAAKFTQIERECLRDALYLLRNPAEIDSDPMRHDITIGYLAKFCEDYGIEQTDIELETEILDLERERAKFGF
jgi:hypothetical protein